MQAKKNRCILLSVEFNNIHNGSSTMLNYPTDGGQEKKPCFSNFVTPNCEIHSKTPLKNPIVANQAVIEYLYSNHPPQGVDVKLCDISERDSVWDSHRNQTSLVSDIYSEIQEFERYAERLDGCSGYLKFGWNDSKFVLKQAFFCRVRYCPVCQWRRSLLWKALMYQTYEQIKEQYPTHRFIFLTLTVKNPHITDLRSQLEIMNKACKKLTKRKEFGIVDGWIRTTEVTRPKLPRKNKKAPIVYCPKTKNTHAHPHFHCILMVKPSYFGVGYLKQSQWAELWQSCLGVDYLPVVDVRTVRKKGKDKSEPITDDDIKSAIAETLKYATKPDEITLDCHDPQSREWFYELTRQTHKMRFVASGGALKNALKADDKISNEDMIKTGNEDDTEQTDEKRLNFTYYPTKGSYIYNPVHNE